MKNRRVKNKFFQYAFFSKNRRGWVKVLEVFVSIILVMAIIFFILNRGGGRFVSTDAYEMELSILKKVQFNESLRGIILDESSLPVNWSSFNSGELLKIKQVINEGKIASFECEARICSLSDLCLSEVEVGKDIYAQSAVISADSNTYSPRQLKLFCWEK